MTAHTEVHIDEDLLAKARRAMLADGTCEVSGPTEEEINEDLMELEWDDPATRNWYPSAAEIQEERLRSLCVRALRNRR